MAKTSRLPYILASSAVGGAIGFWMTTNSGKRFIHAVRHLDTGELQNRIENSRAHIEDKVRNISSRVTGAIDHGLEVYENALGGSRAPLNAAEPKNDRMSRTVKTFGDSLVGPFYELSALVKAIKHGLSSFAGKNDDFDNNMDPIGEPAPFYKESRGSII